MNRILCKSCRHFKEAPYQASKTGCWHPDNLLVRQKDAFLDQQQLPGDHIKINLRGDCEQYEARPAKPTLLERFFALGA